MSVNKNAINNQIQDRGKYSQVPNEIWEVKDITVYAREIWIYLLSCHPQWKGSIANLSRNLGFSLSTAKRAVEQLESFGMLKTTQHNKGTDFDIRPSSEWSCRLSGLGPDDSSGIDEASLTAQRSGASNTNTNTFSQDSPEAVVEKQVFLKNEGGVEMNAILRRIKKAEQRMGIHQP